MVIKYKIEIECSNSAFAGNAALEITRILKKEAIRIANLSIDPEKRLLIGEGEASIRDANGNRVGKAGFIQE